MSRKNSGRTRLYRDMIARLDPDHLYSAASLAAFVWRSGYLDPKPDETGPWFRADALRIRLRRTMANWVRNHPQDFPDKGDGTCPMAGQNGRPAWHGWRWQQSYLGQRTKHGPQ